MNKLRTAVLAGAAALTLVVPAASRAAEPPPSGTPAPAVDRFTGLAVSVLAQPHPVPAADGHLHLAYELLLTNTTSASPHRKGQVGGVKLSVQNR